MKRYRVTAIQPAIYEIIVEANSEEDALKIADEIDEGWSFCEYREWNDYEAEEEA
tara:strand:- start:366 stop:530 length:165 start_codon:yes stop_codon:yes gene_type:complete